MDRAALDRVIDEFWMERGRGVYFPPAWEDRLDLDDAYRIQLGLVARRCTGGVTHVGWKVGLTAKPIQLALALADNAQQKFFVLGAPVRLAEDLDLSAIGVRVSVNGAEVGAGRGEAVLGHPLRSVAWLAGKLGAYGRGLKAGDHIMT